MIPRSASILRCAIRPNFERESLPTTLREGTARTHLFPRIIQIAKSFLFYLLEVVRPERLELPAFWFVDTQWKTLSAASGVAYSGTRHLSRP